MEPQFGTRNILGMSSSCKSELTLGTSLCVFVCVCVCIYIFCQIKLGFLTQREILPIEFITFTLHMKKLRLKEYKQLN